MVLTLCTHREGSTGEWGVSSGEAGALNSWLLYHILTTTGGLASIHCSKACSYQKPREGFLMSPDPWVPKGLPFKTELHRFPGESAGSEGLARPH